MWMMLPGPWPVGPQPAPPRVSTADRVLSATRHPSFSPDVAVRLVHGLSCRDLHRAWASSNRALADASGPQIRLAIVILRAELLRELEVRDPAAFDAWYAGLVRRSRSPQRTR